MSNRATFDQAYQMLNLAREAGISLERFQALCATGLLSDLLKVEDPTAVDRDKFRTLLGFDPSVFKLMMGGPETTDQIVTVLRESGIWVNDYVTQKNFPLTSGEAIEDEIELVDPNRDFSLEESLAILKEKGLVRPTYQHAIRFSQQHGLTTTSTKKPWVIFPHEPWQDPLRNPHVIYVNRHPGNRRLNLNYTVNRFFDSCVLAGVRPRKQLQA